MKYIKCGFFLCIFGMIMPSYAGDYIINLSEFDSRINAYKNAFIAEENLRKRLFYLGSAAAAVGIGGLTYCLFNNGNNDSRLSQNEIEKVKQLIINTKLPEEQKNNTERTAVHIIDNKTFIDTKPWYNKLWNYAKSKVPSLALGLFTHIVWNKTLEFIEPALPRVSKIGDKLFSSRSIGWFIENKTTTQRILQDIVRCINSESGIDGQEFSSLVSLFVIQCEKVLAFISYVVDFLSPDQSEELLRAITIKDKVKKLICELVEKVNDLVISNKDKIEYNLKINNILLGIVNGFESFIAVEFSAGFEDDTPRQIFQILRSIINQKFDKVSAVSPIELAGLMNIFGVK